MSDWPGWILFPVLLLIISVGGLGGAWLFMVIEALVKGRDLKK